jgi:hypothetical protein
MDVVGAVLHQEDNKIKIAVTAAFLDILEHGSVAQDTGYLPNCTATNYDAVVGKIIALKVGKPAVFTRIYHLS